VFLTITISGESTMRTMIPLLCCAIVIAVITGCVRVANLPEAATPEAVAQETVAQEYLIGEWLPLFDGKTLDGWKASESQSTWSVVDGAIVSSGPRSHLFYDGPVAKHDFKNFELKLQFKLEGQSNSGLFFHTAFDEVPSPPKGYEVQINSSPVLYGEE
jgi:hypothetical protein